MNIILLFSALSGLLLVYSFTKYQRSSAYRNKIQRHPILNIVLAVFLLLVSQPILFFVAWSISDYFENQAFKAQNQQVADVYQSMMKDDVAAFAAALKRCETCVSRTEPGKKKYDELIVSAKEEKAMHVKAFLEDLNRYEVREAERTLDYPAFKSR